MSTPAAARPALTARDFRLAKGRAEHLVLVSAYDALFARLAEQAGVDAILVGDSVGSVVAGFPSTVQVTLDQMIYHGAAVRRGAPGTMVIVDMPFLTYQASEAQALENCGRVMRETGANAVKLEGGGEPVERAVRALSRVGVPVMAHLGFTPQSLHAIGGYRVQAREPGAAARLVEEARALEAAGAFAIVLELMPAAVAAEVTRAVTVPTVGIGAGADCDGQVLVLLDLLGLNDGFRPRFLKPYAALADDARAAIRRYADEVRRGEYPDAQHSF